MKTKNKILIAKILSKLLLFFISKNQIVVRKKIKWNLNLEEGIDLSIFLFGSSEKKVLNFSKLLQKKDAPITIIDIGANIGSVSLIMAKTFKNSKVFAIEPTNYAFQKLSKNLDLNDDLKDKVFLKQLFISENKKPQKVWSSWNFENSDNKHQKHMGTLKEIKQNSYIDLEKFIKNEKLTSVDFIKLDVDGYELDVLKSGKIFLAKTKPIIFIELAPYLYPEFGYSCEELVKFIINLNYNFYDENLKEIKDIFSVIKNMKDGSSRNFFLI
tara:strand:- start:18 stop:827 length:810 start_codon:yes stop_codon:yes gene_type:complete